MKIINPSVQIEGKINGKEILSHIERCGRTCYKSEGQITPQSSIAFSKMIIERGHESVIEHCSISFRIICDRGVSHELIRHRIASYSQESTRYCNYSDNRFGSELTFIKPCFWDENTDNYKIWFSSMKESENNYMDLINAGASPQEARSVLPNSLKTEIVMTMNIRELRHFLKLRTSKLAHPQMQEISFKLLSILKEEVPILFDDII